MEEKVDIKWAPLVEKLNDIPTLPMVANQVTNLINDPNSSSGDIAAVLRKDQVLTAKVLKLINSPYYGIPGEVTDVQRALAFLGFNTIAQLVLSLSVFSLFPRDGKESFSVLEFWKHALATAVVSEMIAKKVGYERPEETFTCGLLHDIGKLVLKQIAPVEFEKVVSLAKKKSISYTAAEEAARDPPLHPLPPLRRDQYGHHPRLVQEADPDRAARKPMGGAEEYRIFGGRLRWQPHGRYVPSARHRESSH